LLDTDRIRIQIRDPNEMNRIPILGPRNYATIKEFQDREKLGLLDIYSPQIAREKMWVIIEVLPLGGIVDVSEGFFDLGCTRIRPAIRG